MVAGSGIGDAHEAPYTRWAGEGRAREFALSKRCKVCRWTVLRCYGTALSSVEREAHMRCGPASGNGP